MMDRRIFLKSVAMCSVAPFLYKCGNEDSPISPADEFDYVFSSSGKDAALTVKDQFSEIQTLARNPGAKVSYGIQESSGGYKAVTMSMMQGGVAGYNHPVITRNGESAHLVFGWDGIAPTVKLVDDAGDDLTDPAGKSIEIPFTCRASASKLASFDSGKLLALGLEVAAIAFGVWLGAKILGIAIAALAFVAFNALLIGIIMSAAGALGPATEWILDKFGLSIEEVKSYFSAGLDTLVDLMEHIAQSIQSGYAVD